MAKKENDNAFNLFSKVIFLGVLVERNVLSTAYVNRAVIHTLRDEHIETIQDCNDAIKLIPKFGYAYAIRAMGRAMLDNAQSAIDDCQSCINIAPNEYYGHSTMGWVQSHNNQDILALSYLDRALELNSKLPLLSTNRGVVRMRAGRFQEALDDFNEAIEKGGSTWQILINRAYTYLCLGDFAKCADDIDGAARVAPEELYVFSTRALLFIEQSNLEEADEQLRGRLEGLPKTSRSASILFTKGLVCKAFDRYDVAIEYFDKALDISPKSREAIWQKGDVWESMGRVDEGNALKSTAMAMGYVRCKNY